MRVVLLLVPGAAHLSGHMLFCQLCSRCPLAIISGCAFVLPLRLVATMHRRHVSPGSVTVTSVNGWCTFSQLSYFSVTAVFWCLLGAPGPLCRFFQFDVTDVHDGCPPSVNELLMTDDIIAQNAVFLSFLFFLFV